MTTFQKLNLKEQSEIFILNAPKSFEKEIASLKGKTRIKKPDSGESRASINNIKYIQTVYFNSTIPFFHYSILPTLYPFLIPSHPPFNISSIAPTPRMQFAKQTRNLT